MPRLFEFSLMRSTLQNYDTSEISPYLTNALAKTASKYLNK